MRTTSRKGPLGAWCAASIIACAPVIEGCSSSSAPAAPLDPNAKFATLAELLANADIQAAIASLPAGDGVKAGAYYEGDTPADVSGTWSTTCCGGSTGDWVGINGQLFGGTVTFQVTGAGHVDLPLLTGTDVVADGKGSFIVGTGNDVTVFAQLSERCNADAEQIRVVTIDRFVFTASTSLSQYIRSYVVLARGNVSGPWNCDAQPVGSGATSTSAVFGWDP